MSLHLGKAIKKVGKTLKQVHQATTQGLIKGVVKDPSRLLTGVDPLSTKLWNTILGTNKKSLVNVTGGPTGRTLNKIGATGLTRGVFKVADTVAMYFGTMGAANGLGNAFGGMTAGTAPAATSAPGTVSGAGTGAGTGAFDSALTEVQLAPGVQRVGGVVKGGGGLLKSGGIIGGALRNPLVQSSLVSTGGQLIAGAMADRADKKDWDKYNRNVGTELWPTPPGA